MSLAARRRSRTVRSLGRYRRHHEHRGGMARERQNPGVASEVPLGIAPVKRTVCLPVRTRRRWRQSSLSPARLLVICEQERPHGSGHPNQVHHARGGRQRVTGRWRPLRRSPSSKGPIPFPTTTHFCLVLLTKPSAIPWISALPMRISPRSGTRTVNITTSRKSWAC